ncbi:uncharacterized protein LOC143919624 [Arctopsyche grandis]|uniref:uncharacterized protein LOC143919624 n=1 Tax=Arctopsyche grandis TaxID=121162 RepID=UPI00406D832A
MLHQISNMNPQDAISQCNIPPIDFEPHLLISPVRKQYFEYLFNLLKQNYTEWCGEFPPHVVLGATKELELQAATQAMVVPLYRQSICLMINSIKQYTKNKDLYPKFGEYCVKTQFCDKSSQTDDELPMDRTDQTQTSSNSQISMQNGISPKENMVQKDYNEANDEIADQVLKDMEELFKTDETELDKCDIFGDNTNEIHIKLIMEEIKMFDNKKTDRLILDSENCNIVNNDLQNTKNIQMYEKCEENVLIGSTFIETKTINMQSKEELSNQNGFVYSRWPCELYYQKKILREKLDDLCEQSFRMHSRVRSRFIEIFGVESEDEQGLQSPDTSISFVRSCRQRIAPWIARHIKHYYSRGNIPSHLFRPHNKYLAYKLLQINQFPSDYEVYLFIKEYFKHHSRIKCQADF